MGTGYTRADTANNIADGNIINASDLDSEYDAIQSAFDASTGHTHDGTAGEGAPIETIGPSQDVVATASVLRPKTDNTVDLGTTSLEYKDLFLDGTAHIDTLDVDENASITGTLGVTGTTTLGTANITTGTITTADINGGNIDGTIIGATTAAAITGTTITGTSFVTSGDMTFGDNDRAIFGAGSDLQVFHDAGGTSHIRESGPSHLYIEATNLRLKSSADTGETYLTANLGGAVSLYYDNAIKLATTSTGIDVTGTVTADGLTIDTDAYRRLLLTYPDAFTSKLQIGFSNFYVQGSATNDRLTIANNSSGQTHFENQSKTSMVIDNSGDISFYEDTGTTPKFFWDASAESLGIGTSSPDKAIHVKTSVNNTAFVRIESTATDSYPTLSLKNDAREYQLTAHGPLGDKFTIYDGTAGSHRMVIDSSGNLLVGTTTSVNLADTTGNGFQVNSGGQVNIKRTCTSSTQGLLHLNNIGTEGQVVEFYQDGAQVGNISVTSSATAYNTSSDYRLKENVVDLTGATTRLKQLEPKRFNFIADADTTVDGFLAHEVQSVVPEAITGTHNEVDADGNPVYQGIDQSKLVPLLVATIKELEARITALENA